MRNTVYKKDVKNEKSPPICEMTKWERRQKCLLLNKCKQEQLGIAVNVESRQHGCQSEDMS